MIKGETSKETGISRLFLRCDYCGEESKGVEVNVKNG
jgi:hypothetical protein